MRKTEKLWRIRICRIQVKFRKANITNSKISKEITNLLSCKVHRSSPMINKKNETFYILFLTNKNHIYTHLAILIHF